MTRFPLLPAVLLSTLALATNTYADDAAPALKFDRVKLADQPFEAASVCDVDKDGAPDIVSGDYWYEGPAFKQAHRMAEVEAVSGYHDDFHDYPMDVNGDGWIDIVSGGWFGGTLRWHENPKGEDRVWDVHAIDKPGSIETTRFWDVDGDGHVEVCPNAGGNVVFFRLQRDENGLGTGQFKKHVVKLGGCGHGLGFGDINGDGRGDFITPNGWCEAPENPLDGEWTYHADGLNLGRPSVPMLVHDVNGDGLNDMIIGESHDYGLYWLEQAKADDGSRAWSKHVIESTGSQYHDLALVDLDGDGDVELVTGKRYRAHNGHDPGSTDPLFVRYFDIDGGEFTMHKIDEGPAETASGVGIYFWTADVNGDDQIDIVAPGKEGLYLFLNRGKP